MANVIVSAPVLAFAALIASRSVQSEPAAAVVRVRGRRDRERGRERGRSDEQSNADHPGEQRQSPPTPGPAAGPPVSPH